jgi:hypothetical protein
VKVSGAVEHRTNVSAPETPKPLFRDSIRGATVTGNAVKEAGGATLTTTVAEAGNPLSTGFPEYE